MTQAWLNPWQMKTALIKTQQNLLFLEEWFLKIWISMKNYALSSSHPTYSIPRADGSYPDLDYTFRLGSTFGQKFSDFLFFPYQFSGPQVNINMPINCTNNILSFFAVQWWPVQCLLCLPDTHRPFLHTTYHWGKLTHYYSTWNSSGLTQA